MNKLLKFFLSLVVMMGLGFSSVQQAFASNNGNFKFYGTVQSMPAGMYGAWVVDGRTVNVSAATRIKQKYGPIAVGSYVEVKGWLQANGSVDATEVEGKRGNGGGWNKFYGTVQSMPAGMYGTWVVSGRTVNVSAATRIKQKYGPIAVGSYVEVKGFQQADGSVNATEVEGKGGGSSGGGTFYTRFYGIVDSMPAGMYGTWVVSGRTVNVTTATQIKQKYGPIVVGSLVEVKGFQQADGSINASQVEGKR